MVMAASTAWGLAAVAIAPCVQGGAGALAVLGGVEAAQPINRILKVKEITARVLKVIRSSSGKSKDLGLIVDVSQVSAELL